jgi:hypothetical protein
MLRPQELLIRRHRESCRDRELGGSTTRVVARRDAANWLHGLAPLDAPEEPWCDRDGDWRRLSIRCGLCARGACQLHMENAVVVQMQRSQPMTASMAGDLKFDGAETVRAPDKVLFESVLVQRCHQTSSIDSFLSCTCM